MRAGARRLNETGELERTILAVRGAGARRASLRRPRPGRRAAAPAPAGRLVRRPVELDRVRDHGAARGGPPARLGGGAQRGAWLARQQSADGGFSFAGGGGSFVDETGAALQGLPRPAARRGRAATRAVPCLRRPRTPTAGSARPRARVERAVDRLGGAGNRRGRRAPASFRRGGPLAARIPALAPAGGRQLPLLAHERADPGVGHRAGRRGAAAQAVPGAGARAAAREARPSSPRRAAADGSAEPKRVRSGKRRAAPTQATAPAVRRRPPRRRPGAGRRSPARWLPNNEPSATATAPLSLSALDGRSGAAAAASRSATSSRRRS